MEKTNGKVLILEDDSTMASALESVCRKQGFTPFMATRADEANEILSKNNISFLVVDCLLSGTSGIDFVLALRKKYSKDVIHVIIMSGIFTDPSFIKDSISQTQAVGFLKKPFDNKELMDLLSKHSMVEDSNEPLSPRQEIYQFFNNSDSSERAKKKKLEALEEIHGFDLPYIYNILMETKISGHLNIVNSKGEVSGVTFCKGQITAVDILDKETFIGKLLIEGGFIHPSDLNETLNSPAGTKKIGERLIQASLISPHAFNIAMSNQMSIRLSRTVIDSPIKFNFVSDDIELTKPFIDGDQLAVFIHDWIASRIHLDWLKAHYLQWGESTLDKNVTFDERSPILKMPLILSLNGFVNYLTTGNNSFNQLMEKSPYPEVTAYKALHFLLTKGLLVFKQNSTQSADRLNKFKKIALQFKDKKPHEIFDLMARIVGTVSTDPEAIRKGFLKMIGAEPPQQDKEMYEMYQFLKKAVDEGFELAKDGGFDKLKEDKDKSEAFRQMKAVGILDEAKRLLQKAQFSKAYELIQQAQLEASPEKIKLYEIWAMLGLAENSAEKANLIRKVETTFMQVPPEEKFDALYSFVLGLYNRVKGDLATAKKSLEKAVNMDPNMIFARRELAIIMNQTKQKDVLNRDLKDLVAGFFKRK